ncbi:hypothetical protein LB516_20300 [Mesorhizobium sp. CO1-1-7]|uniref:hypothetical protein n=1 Tax=unclassified Mesorhizobium TaxID=325217 RepID=UPI001125D290|nr:MULTISPECIES: hypothetical protein [unclassified Mesorhizobium]MBZ9931772.1 hypothetical protein [Mesorhizobium sp. BR1-1-5]MBZ9747596.1 hypothetical protein [Mesorhizobium sp. CO1-1-7]MBZ9905678.1 hypothetical protein [Mesorhizobium sp. BR115XR7A]TPJ13690.1 hypothetical protein FJW04_18885 [Mesorhizobium sp. B2-7-3]TPK71299.1 hypothetical protein FJ527_27130 [Mesorhizobium sp. B2-4-18]
MPTKINLALPVYGAAYKSVFVRSLFAALTHKSLSSYAFTLSEIEYTDIPFSRNYLLTNFYYNKPDCSHILMIDSDMGFSPDLIAAMLALEKPVVGTLYPRRLIDLRRLHSLSKLPFEKAFARSLEFVGTIIEPRQEMSGFVRVSLCGTGVFLVSRDCVTEIIEKLPETVNRSRYKNNKYTAQFDSFLTPFSKIVTPDVDLPTDFSFCHRWAQQCGGEIWASFDRKVAHAGDMTVSAAYSEL